MHRALDGRGPLPLTLWISRICEEFHCLPSAAYAEWLQAPAGVIEDVIEARSYAAAKAVYDRATNKSQVPSEPIYDLIRTIDFEIAREDIDGAVQR